MVHARYDYNRMQDPALDDPSLLSPGSTPIAADEPVVLFRAQDKFMESVLMAYHDMVATDPDGDYEKMVSVIKSIEQHIIRVRQWQAKRGCKSPDL